MLKYLQGDIMKDDAQALVVPVNCVGVAGAGLALAAKKKYPDWFFAYREACDQGWLRLGECWCYTRCAEDAPRFLISFPTKKHWRDRSGYNAVGIALGGLACDLARLCVSSCAIPALGCGCGGLPWEEVKVLFGTFSMYVPLHDIRVYEPLKRTF